MEKTEKQTIITQNSEIMKKSQEPDDIAGSNDEQRIISQENMFHDLPLYKLPTIKRLVEDVGFEDNPLQLYILRAESAMRQALRSDMDIENKRVWNFIVSTLKFLQEIEYEVLAARRKEVRHAVGKGGDIQIEKEEPKPLDLDEMNEMASKIYKATNGGIRIFTDMYPEARETVITGGKFRTYNGQHTPSAMLTTKSGMWYMVDFGGDSEPTNAIKVYMNKTGLGVDETLRKLFELYVAKK